MKKKFIFIILTLFSLFFVPITYSKYTETVSKSFTLNVRQPRYHVTYLDNDISASIPEEYQKIEYIESTGTQYIDTGVIAKGTIGFEVAFFSNDKFTGSYPGYGSVFGARTGSAKNEIQVTTYSNSLNKRGTFRYGNESYGANINLEVKNYISYLNNEYTVNGIVYDIPRTTFNSNKNITIFAVNNNGTVIQHGHVKLYSLKLYDNNILIRDFVPCFRISDGEIGLYDIVTKSFYINQGTEDFIVNNSSIQTFEYGTSGRLLPNALTRGGYHFIKWNTMPDGSGKSYEDEATVLNLSSKDDDVINLYAQWKQNEYFTIKYHLNFSDLPQGYKPLEFIESTGSEYLDTGVSPKGTIGFETKFKTYNTFSGSESQYGSVFGGRDDSQKNEVQVTTYITELVNYGTFRYANSSYEANIELEKINNIKYLGNTYTTNKGTYQVNRETFQSPYTMTIFAVNDGGEIKQFGRVRMYKLKIYDGETLIRDYVPCYRESDNTPGLYDRVNNKFITNLGTGELKSEKVQQAIYEVKTNLEKNEFERIGYTFHSWNTSQDGSQNSYIDEQTIKFTDYIDNNHIDLYAQWTPNKYQIKFNSNGGSGTMENQQMTYDTQSNLNQNTFTKTGKTFKEWNTSQDGSGVSYSNNQSVINLTNENNKVIDLYAIWQ